VRVLCGGQEGVRPPATRPGCELRCFGTGVWCAPRRPRQRFFRRCVRCQTDQAMPGPHSRCLMDNDSRHDERAAQVWLVVSAALTISALVLALGQVSHQAVRQGEIRRAATAANTTAVWSCYASHSRALRDSCLGQLDLPTDGSPGANATSP